MTETYIGDEPDKSKEESPSNIVSRFLNIHDTYISSCRDAVTSPSDETLSTLIESYGSAKIAFAEIAKNRFFSGKDTESLEMAIMAIANVIIQQGAVTSELRPDSPVEHVYTEDYVETTKNHIFGEEEEAIETMNALYRDYCESSDFLLEKVLNSRQVLSYSANKDTLEKRTQHLIQFSGIALATFAGSSLALYFDRRSRRSNP